MEPFVQTSESVLSIQPWIEKYPSLIAGFTTKNGGVSEKPFVSMNTAFHVFDREDKINQNRQILAEHIQMEVSNWIGCEQTHEYFIKKVGREQIGVGAKDYQSALKHTDGLYTNETDVLLTLCFADCVPIFFFAPKYHLVGMAHAGWKGTVSGIGLRMVQEWMEKEGVQPDEILAVMGPSICQNCYTVDKKVIDLLEEILEEQTKTAYNQITESQFQLDLKLANELILRKAGLPPENISTTAYCTSCDHSLFFSHRRDRGKTGRMMGMIGWRKE